MFIFKLLTPAALSYMQQSHSSGLMSSSFTLWPLTPTSLLFVLWTHREHIGSKYLMTCSLLNLISVAVYNVFYMYWINAYTVLVILSCLTFRWRNWRNHISVQFCRTAVTTNLDWTWPSAYSATECAHTLTNVFCACQLNAMANRAAGKGYENEDNYSNIRFQFQGIENIHVMRNSLQKLLEGEMTHCCRSNMQYELYVSWLLIVLLCSGKCRLLIFQWALLQKSFTENIWKWNENGAFGSVTVCSMKSPSMSDYLTGLESSGWLRHIKSVMDAGVFLAKVL